jgi:hypothetical protein
MGRPVAFAAWWRKLGSIGGLGVARFGFMGLHHIFSGLFRLELEFFISIFIFHEFTKGIHAS